MKPLFYYFILVISWVNESHAQSLSPFVISSSGGFYSNSMGMLSFTAGEMSAVKTYSSSGKILTQGFQQTWDISTAITERTHQHFSFGIYPNPTTGHFSLATKTNRHEPLTIIILDMLGREIMQRKYLQHTDLHVESFDLPEIADGIYLIELKVNEKSANTRNTFFKKIQLIK